jgi:alanyl-tRNA synthetase
MTSAEIRQQFIDFFVLKHGHTFVPSSPVVPLDDPTLLFTNAGMNQFKPIFLGQEKRPYTRAANTQKCIRAGGKHNDLDDVGRSRRHHTFFEMLGNWSFGDYFKRGAIEMAWELLTQVWKLDPTRLHVSCYEGDEKNGIPRDTEAADLWKEIAKLPDDHIHYFGKDNFWEMGDTGPCGPSSEIYYDRTPDKNGGKSVNGDDPRVMEIWNLVFIQYNRDSSGKLTPLPAKHIDTGMGFERICQVLQDKQDNYGTDLWNPLFDRIAEISGSKYTGQFPPTNRADPVAEGANEQLRRDIAFRVVADHIRCLTFAITDGAVPSNEGRGYVLRRILRRAVRFGRQQLNLHEPFLHELVSVIVDSMGNVFSELKTNPQHVMELVKDEEISFERTLDRGIDLAEEAMARGIASEYWNMLGTAPSRVSSFNGQYVIDQSGSSVRLTQAIDILQKAGRPLGQISASDAFKLHDTYGFPIDLTRIMAEERGMSVDLDGYETLMEQAKELARTGGKDEDTSLADLPATALAQLAEGGISKTDDSAKFRHEPIHAKVIAIWNGDDLGLSPASAIEDEELAIILDRTNFYAEMGGQVGDRGELRIGKSIFDVENPQAIDGYVLHIGRLRSGKIVVGDRVEAVVLGGRDRTEKNHTGTHIANWALREVLGDGVQQKGSLVDPEKLRFDFSHPKSLAIEEIGKVEELVGEAINKKLPVYTETVGQELALKINGLRAVFGEKYPPMVRVVSIGAPVKDLLADPTNPKWRQYSIEFCGGTHLQASDNIGKFCVISEESVSKGIRRLVAVTGETAKTISQAGAAAEELIAKSRQMPDEKLPEAISALQQSAAGQIPLRSKRAVQGAIVELQAKYKAHEKTAKASGKTGGVDAIAIAGQLLAKAADLAGGKLIVGEIAGATDDQLRSAVDSLRKKSPSYAILVAAGEGEKVTFVAAVSDDLVAKGLKAGDWVKQVAAVTGGGGGGRPQMAQGSGKDPAKLEDALKLAESIALKIG